MAYDHESLETIESKSNLAWSRFPFEIFIELHGPYGAYDVVVFLNSTLIFFTKMC